MEDDDDEQGVELVWAGQRKRETDNDLVTEKIPSAKT